MAPRKVWIRQFITITYPRHFRTKVPKELKDAAEEEELTRFTASPTASPIDSPMADPRASATRLPAGPSPKEFAANGAIACPTSCPARWRLL